MMAPTLLSAATSALLLASSASAHFLLNTPAPIQAFDDDTEGQAPCGGYTPDLSKITTFADFHVGGDSIGTKSSHPQNSWLYRVTTDNAAAGNWTQINPIFTQSGVGDYCNSKVTVPDSWVGKTAILSVVGDAPDGLLYQCAAVKFVAGTASSVPSDCSTASGVTTFAASDSALSALVDNSSTNGTSSNPPAASGTQTGATASPSASKPASGAASLGVSSAVAVAAAVLGAAAMMV